MGSEEALLRLASHIDSTLDSGISNTEIRHDDRTWDDLLVRNGLKPHQSHYSLDAMDWVVCCITGMGCGVLDLTKQYTGVLHNESLHQKFAALSKDYLRKVTGSGGIAAIDNIKGAALHRMVGPAHDLSRFMEAIGQMMEGEFRSDVHGAEFVSTIYGARSEVPYLKIDSPADAAVVLILHLIGDFFSKTSLPIPGRTKLAESEIKEVVAGVFKEYRAGGNFRLLVSEFLSNLSGAILIAITLRLYRYVRVAVETRTMPALSLKDDPKFHLLDRNAQTISFVISAGKAAFSSNLVALNYMNFVQIVRSAAAINRISNAEEQRLLSNIDAISRRIERL